MDNKDWSAISAMRRRQKNAEEGYEGDPSMAIVQMVKEGVPYEDAVLMAQEQPEVRSMALNKFKQGSYTPSKLLKGLKDAEEKQGEEEEPADPEDDNAGEIGDFVGEEGFFEGKYNDIFNNTDEDRLTDAIDHYNGQREHTTGEGEWFGDTPEDRERLAQNREMEALVEALQRGEAGALAGPEQTFDNSDLSLANAQVQGGVPMGDQSIQAQPADPQSIQPMGISQQQIMEALQNAQPPQGLPSQQAINEMQQIDALKKIQQNIGIGMGGNSGMGGNPGFSVQGGFNPYA